MVEKNKAEHQYKIGDIVWCFYMKDDCAKGFVKECLKGNEYRVEVFLPKTRDERGLNYVMQDIFKSSELLPYEG